MPRDPDIYPDSGSGSSAGLHVFVGGRCFDSDRGFAFFDPGYHHPYCGCVRDRSSFRAAELHDQGFYSFDDGVSSCPWCRTARHGVVHDFDFVPGYARGRGPVRVLVLVLDSYAFCAGDLSLDVSVSPF